MPEKATAGAATTITASGKGKAGAVQAPLRTRESVLQDPHWKAAAEIAGGDAKLTALLVADAAKAAK
jgi:hypothetical protein